MAPADTAADTGTAPQGRFVHLHLHSAYSFLDGAIQLKALINRVKEQGMTAVAVTDHGQMFGAMEFFKLTNKTGVKPIIGVETYVAPESRHDRKARGAHHMVLLAKNNAGYANLCRLVSFANLEGFYYHPRIDKELLAAHHEGIIATSACLAGEIPEALLAGRMDEAERAAAFWRALFGDDFYLELQENGIPEQRVVNEGLITLSKKLNIPLIATADAHYLREEDYDAHDVLVCLGMQLDYADKARKRVYTEHHYVKSPEEMERAFAHVPEAVANTAALAAKCNVDLKAARTVLPAFPLPAGFDDEAAYLKAQAEAGLAARLDATAADADTRARYAARLAFEADVIVKMGFAGYFLIVADFIGRAKAEGIAVGPGRGSGAGSLTAYALGITDLDPIPYNLLFERFLNPERVSMPDFDIDFCMRRRDEVIRYVRDKYGDTQTGQIATFGSLKSRAALKDVGRVLGFKPGDTDRLCKLVPLKQNQPVPLKEALTAEPKLKAAYDESPDMQRLFDTAMRLEGLQRNPGVHAAGVVIADKPLWEYVPVLRHKDTGMLVTQYAKNEVETAGLVKFDFLGLTNLTTIGDAVTLINRRRAAEGRAPLARHDYSSLDDPEVYKMIARGDTANVFQLESPGFQRMLRELMPDRFEDIIAAVSLYRPGPMDLIPEFCARKHGRSPIEYELPELEPILGETYGIIVYQEQVMQIAQAVAGFSLGGADLLRRAMGKKDAAEMARVKGSFVSGAAGRGVNAAVADALFDKIEKFAGYGFNKSHAAAYSVITYQTAWLKHHYPVEYTAAVLGTEIDKRDRVIKDLGTAKQAGIDVLPPDVNVSDESFTPEGGRLRFGLTAVNGVGEGPVEAIREARRAGGPFTGLFDFCRRVDAARVNRKTLEMLVKAGAFDFTGRDRGALGAAIEAAMTMGHSEQKHAKTGQRSLLGAAEPVRGPARPGEDGPYPSVRLSESERQRHEKEALGFYVTGHPLDRYGREVRRWSRHACDELPGLEDGAKVVLCGLLTNVRDRPMKSDPTKRLASGALEDLSGVVEFMVFSKVYERVHTLLTDETEPVLVEGRLEIREEGEHRRPLVQVDNLRRLQDMRAEAAGAVVVTLNAPVGENDLRALESMFLNHKGTVPVVLNLMDAVNLGVQARIRLHDHFRVQAADAVLDAIEARFGQGSVRVE